jgi:hypothetical protein
MERDDAPRYYMMGCENEDAMMLSHLQEVDGQDWFEGRPFRTRPQEPIEIFVSSGYEDRVLLEFFPVQMLMREDLVACLRGAGVDNMEVYDAVVRDTESAHDYEGYKAVNVVGVIAAADRARTIFHPDNPSRLINADIESLYIDPAKTGGALMFRLAEAITGLIVHENVKNAVEAGDFPNMIFADPEEWVG